MTSPVAIDNDEAVEFAKRLHGLQPPTRAGSSSLWNHRYAQGYSSILEA